MAKEKMYDGNIFNDLRFLIGLGRNPYKIKLDRGDIFPYLFFLILYLFAQLLRAIPLLPALVGITVGWVMERLAEILDGFNHWWLDLMQHVPYPGFFNRFRTRLWEKYQGRLSAKRTPPIADKFGDVDSTLNLDEELKERRRHGFYETE